MPMMCMRKRALSLKVLLYMVPEMRDFQQGEKSGIKWCNVEDNTNYLYSCDKEPRAFMAALLMSYGFSDALLRCYLCPSMYIFCFLGVILFLE